MDFPSAIMPPTISSFSRYSCGTAGPVLSSQGIATSGQAANAATYIPFWLPAPFVVRRMFVYCGAVAAGNIDLGVLSLDGALITSAGTTAMTVTSDLQIVTVTETLLPAGRYYMALSRSDITATFWRNAQSTQVLRGAGVLQAASQVPLANNPTFIAITNGFAPYIGISSITTF